VFIPERLAVLMDAKLGQDVFILTEGLGFRYRKING
jgi:hypothetical protein